MEAALPKVTWRPPLLDWHALVPKCSSQTCRYRRTRWRTLLRRHQGVRCGENWYCCPECLEQFLASRLHSMLAGELPRSYAPAHRIPIGLILLSRGQIEHDTLQQALAAQRSDGGRIGDCLRRLSAITEDQITSALAKQWSCPVYPLSRGSECRHLLPRELQNACRMLPVHFVESTRELYVAFEQSVDYTALLAIEHILECHTRPCILPESEIRVRLAQDSLENSDPEIVFASSLPAQELAHNIVGYVQQIEADRVRFADCGAYIWLRLQAGIQSFDILVRR